MCKDEVRSLHLPSNLAWGEMAPSPLPANCSVHYKVKLTIVTSLHAVIMTPNYVLNVNWNHAVTNPRWSLRWSRRGSCSQSQPLLLPGQLKRCLACSIAHPLKWLFLIIKLSYETEQTLHFSSGLLCQRWHSCVPGITVDRHDAWPSFVEEDDMWLPNQFSNFIHRDSGMLSSWPLAIFCFCSAVGNRIVILKWPSLQ